MENADNSIEILKDVNNEDVPQDGNRMAESSRHDKNLPDIPGNIIQDVSDDVFEANVAGHADNEQKGK